MRIVAYQFKIFVNESVDFLHVRIHLHGWQWAGLATELQASLFEVVLIEMQIAESVNEGSPACSPQTWAIIRVKAARTRRC